MILQKIVDESYPPTHQYNVETLEPKGVTAERLRIIEENFPGFFSGRALLDVGCNMGFFSLRHANKFRQIVAIDPDEKAVSVCREVARLHSIGNVSFLNESFREFASDSEFDKIFLGNVHHHLFREINGHEWIDKLAALSSSLVLMEGPYNTACEDIKNFPPSFNSFPEKMNQHFVLRRIIPSVSYTPGRYFMLWEKRQLKTPKRNVIKKYFKKDKYVNKVSVFIAACSPVSNGIAGFIRNGWVESKSEEEPYRYFENEEELFCLHCIHQVYLSKLGYWDVDPATINFFKGSNKLFDKSGVMPIKETEQKHIDLYFILLNQSYRKIPETLKSKIRKALETKSPAKIEETFAWARLQVAA